MHEYRNIVLGTFIERLNRFIAQVALEGEIVTVHVKNTGRCKELLIPGTTVSLEPSDNPDRKTKFSLVAVKKGDVWVNLDSQVPNEIVHQALEKGYFEEIGSISYSKREVTYGKSRLDIYYESDEVKGFIEVKGVTLEVDGLSMFPDAPTPRGAKHIRELTESVKNGYKNYICFLIQIPDIQVFRPHVERDRDLAVALKEAVESGVGVLLFNCDVTASTIEIADRMTLMPIDQWPL